MILRFRHVFKSKLLKTLKLQKPPLIVFLILFPFSYIARAKRRKIETSDELNTKKSKVKQENEYDPYPFKRSPYQTPHPSREQTPESFPLSSSPTKPDNIPEPLPPKTLSVKSPIKEELAPEGTPEKHKSPPKVSASPSTVYRCYYCEDKFSKMSIRMNHMRNIHSNRVKGWDGTKTGRGNLFDIYISIVSFSKIKLFCFIRARSLV